MIVVRDIFQAKYGRGGKLVALFKEVLPAWGQNFNARILTDASGPFFTVVTEVEMASLAEWEQWTAKAFAMPEFGEWFERMVPLVESGRREFYHIEAPN
jgi:hypothetical protein